MGLHRTVGGPQTLLQTPTSITPMERLQAFLSKIAHTHPNPLLISFTTTLQDRFNHFVSHYQTPDHPPYSAMIERALGELKDKRGSSEESISQFLEKTYSNLPLAHSAFLKHHLAKLCESGDIVATSSKRYMLPMETPTLNLSANFERRPKRRKCQWAWERELKKRLKKKRNLRRSKQIDVFENNMEPNEEVEHQVCSKHKQVELGQTKRLLSCDGRNYIYGDPSVFPTERRSFHHEISPSEITGGDGGAVHVQGQEEMRQARYDPSKDLSPERPPGFEFSGVKNLSSVDSKVTVAQSFDEDIVETERALRWLMRLTEKSERRRMAATCVKVEVSPKSEFSHSNLVCSQNQQTINGLTLPSVEQTSCDKQQTGSLETSSMEGLQFSMASIKMKGDKIYCRRRKRKLEESEADTWDACIKLEQPNLELPLKVGSPNSNQLSDKQESQDVIQQQLPQQQEDISEGKQLRRSSRARIPKHDIVKCGNDVDTSDEESMIRFYRSQRRQPKRKLSDQITDESQQKRNLKRNSVPRDDDNSESELKQLRKPNGSIYHSNSKWMLLVETRAATDSRVVDKGKMKCGESDEDYLPPPVILALGQHKRKGKGKGRGPGKCSKQK